MVWPGGRGDSSLGGVSEGNPLPTTDKELLKCAECGKLFHYGDQLWFKPIPYLRSMEHKEVEIAPYCKTCIVAHTLDLR